MDLTTKYLGLTLKNPVVASASPLSESLDNIKKMEDAGAAAVMQLASETLMTRTVSPTWKPTRTSLDSGCMTAG